MKPRLTPLNLISSILLVSVAYLFLYPDENGFRKLGAVPLIVMFVLSLLMDLIFRRVLVDLKKIWLAELMFLVFVVLLFLMIT